MVKKTRLVGVDLCRGLATYAVILVHSGDETWGIPVNPEATAFRLMFYFAVPFFLAASFYFMTSKPDVGTSSKFWQSRIERILVPYAIWTVIYLILRLIIFLLNNKLERFNELLQDPLSIIFFGGTSYHLYFLPLLFSGTVLMLMAPYLSQRFSVKQLLIATVVSIIIYELLLASENEFFLGPNIAFQKSLDLLHIQEKQYPLLRLILVASAWIIKCLPYFFVATTLNLILPKINSPQFYSSAVLITFFAVFFICNVFGGLFLPDSLREILLAYTLLIFSISLSSHLKPNQMIASLGACSFGIYLIHPFALNVVKPFVGKVFPQLVDSVTIPSMLILSIPSFWICWLVVGVLTRNKSIAKYMFGV